MSSEERMLISHLARRAGFGATPDELVDTCLDLIGPTTVSSDSRISLLAIASRTMNNLQDNGETNGQTENRENDDRIIEVLKSIVSSREYQLC